MSGTNNSGVRVCYMAHPIGGDVVGNVARAKRWLAYLQRAHGGPAAEPRRAFIAPYLAWIELKVLDEHSPMERAHGLNLAIEAASRCDEFWPVGCSHQREHVAERAAPPPLDIKREWVLGLSTGMYAEYYRWMNLRPLPVAEAGLHRQYLFEHEPPLRPTDLDALELARRGGVLERQTVTRVAARDIEAGELVTERDLKPENNT